MSAADSLGYRPAARYEQAVVDVVDWLVEATRDRDWRELMPRAAEYMGGDFDYAAEDAFLSNG
jgi:hypothetical protein